VILRLLEYHETLLPKEPNNNTISIGEYILAFGKGLDIVIKLVK